MPLGYIPYLPPGTLLFTAIVWRHLLNGATHKNDSIQEIYGHVGGGKRNLFGQRVKFASTAVFGGSLSPEEVLIRHTLFGIYSRALPKHVADSWAMDLVDGRQIRGRLPGQVQRSGTSKRLHFATTALRSCRTCVTQEMDEVGYASWHILHMLPPVHHCPKHGDALIREVEEGIGRKMWNLQLPTGISLDTSNYRFESASDGYASYLRLWIDVLDGNLPLIAADSWANCMNSVADRMGSTESAISEISKQLTRS